jgi:hypothetical protein
VMLRPSKSASTGAGRSPAWLIRAVLRPPRTVAPCFLSRQPNAPAETGSPNAGRGTAASARPGSAGAPRRPSARGVDETARPRAAG